MNLSDIGLITSIRAYGEGAAIVKILTKNHGLHKFVTPKSLTRLKDYRSSFQVGNLIEIDWYTKNDDGFGVVTSYYLQSAYLAKVIFFQTRLNCFQSLISLIELNFPEKEVCPTFFGELADFMIYLTDSSLNEEEILVKYQTLCSANFYTSKKSN